MIHAITLLRLNTIIHIHPSLIKRASLPVFVTADPKKTKIVVRLLKNFFSCLSFQFFIIMINTIHQVAIKLPTF